MDGKAAYERTSTEGAGPLKDVKYGDHLSLTYFLRTMLAECYGKESHLVTAGREVEATGLICLIVGSAPGATMSCARASPEATR